MMMDIATTNIFLTIQSMVVDNNTLLTIPLNGNDDLHFQVYLTYYTYLGQLL